MRQSLKAREVEIEVKVRRWRLASLPEDDVLRTEYFNVWYGFYQIVLYGTVSVSDVQGRRRFYVENRTAKTTTFNVKRPTKLNVCL